MQNFLIYSITGLIVVSQVYSFTFLRPIHRSSKVCSNPNFDRLPDPSLFPSIEELLRDSDAPDSSSLDDIYGPIPTLPSDKYPSNLTDEEIIKLIKEEKQLENDRWQSVLFRDNQCGEWDGSFESFILSQESDLPSKIFEGRVTTTMTPSERTQYGLNITISEKYYINKEFNTAINHLELFKEFLLNPTRKFYGSTDFRTYNGIQTVANVYSVGQTVIANNKISGYIAEIGCREGPTRTRVRYAYSLQNKESILDLLGFVIVRESLPDCTPSDLSLLYNSIPGIGIYDPQDTFWVEDKNQIYSQVNLSGKLSLLFPKYLQETGKAVLTMEWQGKTMRYQIDRKITQLENASLKTLELTEVRIEDSQAYPAAFPQQPDLLK